jgi:hypothetical protein
MRFRPANIRLINRRSNLPRPLLALSSKNNKCNDKDENDHAHSQRLTRSLHIRDYALIEKAINELMAAITHYKKAPPLE